MVGGKVARLTLRSRVVHAIKKNGDELVSW